MGLPSWSTSPSPCATTIATFKALLVSPPEIDIPKYSLLELRVSERIFVMTSMRFPCSSVFQTVIKYEALKTDAPVPKFVYKSL